MIQLHGVNSITLNGDPVPAKVMVGNHHVVCGAGYNEEEAMTVEERLVGKYSFGHSLGLNMIPGGKAGVAYLHRLNVLPADRPVIVDEDREKLLEAYLEEHPRKGLPNPLLAEHWKDDTYASRIICGGERRLSVEQVRRIRIASEEGLTDVAICKEIGAQNVDQVRRVLTGKTYTRIH